MSAGTDSTVDFSTYTDAQLLTSAQSVNALRYPANALAIKTEIEKRKSERRWLTEKDQRAGSSELEPISPELNELKIEYTGTGREYFPIWIANFLLCLLTLGLFTPWAKVRSRRYFYSRSLLDGHSFSYLGDPRKILAGRLIVAAFALFMFLNNILVFVSVRTFGIAVFVGAPLLPFIVWKSARFNFSNSSFRGLPLSLDLTLGEVYIWFSKTWGWIIITCGFGMLTISYRYRAFFISHLRFGQQRVELETTEGAVMAKLLPVVFLFWLIFGIAIAVAMNLPGMIQPASRVLTWLSFGLFLGVSDAVTATILFGHLKLGPIRFRSNLDKWELAALYVKAGALTFFTAGFAWPWMRTQILKYKLERIRLFAPTGAFDEFHHVRPAKDSSTGGFATELFEFDFGL